MNYLLTVFSELFLQVSSKSIFHIKTLIIRNSHQRCSIKELFLRISQFSQENTFARASFSRVECLRPATLLKRNSGTGFSCKLCKIFKNTFFAEHVRMSASQLYTKYQPLLKSDQVSVRFKLCLSLHLKKLVFDREDT